MITLTSFFLKIFTPNEQIIMLHLLLMADSDGMVEFSDRRISKDTEISYQQVRTIHQRWLKDGIVTNAPDNAVNNANKCFITICDYESYNVINIFSNAVSNAVTSALKEQEKGKETESHLPQTPTLKDKEKDKEKDKDKEKKEKTSSFDVRADLSYVEEEYSDMWNEWLDYKDEIKKQYKTQVGAKKQFTAFKNLAQGDLGRARAIVDQSIMRNWDGLFDVKDYVPQSSQGVQFPANPRHGDRIGYDWFYDAEEERWIKDKETDRLGREFNVELGKWLI